MSTDYCLEYKKDWDEGVHMLLFAAREAVQGSLGFSPFELVFGHKLLKEKWLCEETNLNLLDYVSGFKQKLKEANEFARENLKQSQTKMKTWYDKSARNRVFNPGDKVLVFLRIPGNPLQARYPGPCEVESKVSELDYVVKTPGRKKQTQLCHVNMMKEYVDRNESGTVKPISALASVECNDIHFVNNVDLEIVDCVDDKVKLKNSDVLSHLDKKLCHLSSHERMEMGNMIHKFEHLFPDVPHKTTLMCHDVDVGDATPIKQHPYRLNPEKAEHLKNEITYMLENDIIEPSCSEWSSPCVLVPKPDKSYRFCTDFRKVNVVTKTDSYPIPRIDDCIDKIGHAKYVTKFDLLKGYWQVPLTERAIEVCAFVTPHGLYQDKVMPFGMTNSPATFQRLMNQVISDLDDCECYIDDVVIYSDTFEQHMKQIHQFFERVSMANFTVNLVMQLLSIWVTL